MIDIHRGLLMLAVVAGLACGGQKSSPEACGFFSAVDVRGSWSTKDDCGSTTIYSLDSIELGLVANQVWVLVRGVPSGENCRRLDLYLIEPVDLGSGGMEMAWDSFSRRKPIGALEFIDDGKMLNSWDGFYDEQGDSAIHDFAFDWDCGDTLFNSEKNENGKTRNNPPDPEKNAEFYANKWLVIVKTESKIEKCDCGNNAMVNTSLYKNLKGGYFACVAGAFAKQSESEAFSRTLKKQKIDNYVKKAGDCVK